MKTKVSIVKGSKNPQEEEIRGMVERAIKHIGGIGDIISKGDRVLIKPNVCYVLKPGETEVSDPRIAKAIYDILLEMDAKPVIAESSGSGSGSQEKGEQAFETTGYFDLRDQGYNVVNLKVEGESITVDNPKAKVLKTVKIWKLAKEVDVIINLPVIKTHDHMPATLGLKNMKGMMPDSEKKKFHRQYPLYQAIADLNLVVKPHLTIVDGIFCREGLGYPWSEELEMDLVLAGRDPVAVDTVTLLVMDIDPKLQKHAVMAEEHGIGTMDLNKIEVVGEKIEDVKKRFKTPAEALQEIVNIQEFTIISDEKTCTGCRGMMNFFLKGLEQSGQLSEIRKYTFVMGEQESLPDLDKDKTVLIGPCTERYKELGLHVPGCPPLSITVKEAIFAAAK